MVVLVALIILAHGCAERTPFSLTETTITIPQVDYEPAIYYSEGDPYPHVDFSKVNRDTVVQKEHQAVILENEYIRLSFLPEMGRVYSLIYKPTGHEEFWHNDVVNVGGGVNDTGWWMWIGGVEYDLPGDEHGTTWAERWTWEIAENSEARKTVRMHVQERGTKLEETLDISIYPGKAYYEAAVTVTNSTDRTVQYAQWTNPQWAPGGHNELTDNTEFIIPTERILIEAHWEKHLGPSPQDWVGNPLRFIHGWKGMGGLMADGLSQGFYSAYSHDEEEGVVRVFDKEKTPGAKVWTYGYHTTKIPMGSGAPNKGYVEMWGGTAKIYAVDRHPLKPGASVHWTDWMYPYQGTKGLTAADRDLAVNFKVDLSKGKACLGLCPSGMWRGEVGLWIAPKKVEIQNVEPHLAGEKPLRSWSLQLRPDRPFYEAIDLSERTDEEIERLILGLGRSGEKGWWFLEPECNP
jgi:hypothetical protein